MAAPARISFGSLASARRYRVRDTFSGSAVNTGLWTKVDSASKISVASDLLSFASGVATPQDGDPALIKTVRLARQTGLTLEAKIRQSATNVAGGFLAWANTTSVDATSKQEYVAFLDASGTISTRNLTTAARASGSTYSANTWKYLRIVLQATGALYYTSDNGISWKLIWEETTGTVDPLYPSLWDNNGAVDVDYCYVYKGQARPAPASDSFTRANSASVVGVADSGQTWSTLSGTCGISSNAAYGSQAATVNLAVVTTGVADGIVDLTNSTFLTGDSPTLILRTTNFNNRWELNTDNTGYTLRKFVDGSATTVATAVGSPASGDKLRAVLNGSSIKIYVNGTQKISASDAHNATATAHGYRCDGTTARFDDFKAQGGIP